MKNIVCAFLIFAPASVWAQFGIGIHQSNLPFVGFSYELEDRFRPEFRISTDNYFEALSAEAILTYDIVNKSDFEFYAGLGYRGDDFRGLTVPIGINVYPFEVKKFGFHLELTPILGEESLLRGSWGIRYRFMKDTE
ncbi:MAG TPA: hypothetical protein DHV26_03290 [Cytophagales bacterium]|nr:hypothetical protein [Cytophagales bacterium]HRG11562.1 hypothetical protein [Cyclobacteriaceae bacterium]